VGTKTQIRAKIMLRTFVLSALLVAYCAAVPLGKKTGKKAKLHRFKLNKLDRTPRQELAKMIREDPALVCAPVLQAWSLEPCARLRALNALLLRQTISMMHGGFFESSCQLSLSCSLAPCWEF